MGQDEQDGFKRWRTGTCGGSRVKDASFIGSFHSFHFRLRRNQIELMLNVFFISLICVYPRLSAVHFCWNFLRGSSVPRVRTPGK
jgi:hypothetical protein